MTRRNIPVWLDKRAVLATHQMLLAEFGGSPGLRDEGLLDSALARPRNLHGYESADIVMLAASYAAGIVGNHPFIDGNKRAGALASYVLLRLNGYEYPGDFMDFARRLVAVAEAAGRAAATEGFAAWLQANVTTQDAG